MDRTKIIDALGLISGGNLAITDLQIVQWGRDIIFECECQTIQPDDTPDELVVFRLIFKDCRDLHWKSYAHIALAETGEVANRTDVAELLLGQGNHRRDANILTSNFAATISYGSLIYEYDDKQVVHSN